MRKHELHPRTAVLNRLQKNKSKRARLSALHWLAEQFPEAFNNKLRIRPLKKGIMNDLLQYTEQAAEAGISKSKLREAVVLFTRRIDYLACLKAQETRIDLQGQPVDQVSTEEAERAAAKIKKRVEKSAKNARKANASKSPPPSASSHYHPMTTGSSTSAFSSTNSSASSPSAEHGFPVYPPRSYPSNNAVQNNKSAPVVIKRKTSKSYDPDTVARLKEKLGLANRLGKKEETTE